MNENQPVYLTMFSRTDRTCLSLSLILFLFTFVSSSPLCSYLLLFFPFTRFHFFSFTSTSISISPLLLSSLPTVLFSLLAMTSVLFIFHHVHGPCSAMDGAVAALARAPNRHAHTTRTRPRKCVQTRERAELSSKLSLTLRAFCDLKYRRQTVAPTTLPWKPCAPNAQVCVFNCGLKKKKRLIS